MFYDHIYTLLEGIAKRTQCGAALNAVKKDEKIINRTCVQNYHLPQVPNHRSTGRYHSRVWLCAVALLLGVDKHCKNEVV